VLVKYEGVVSGKNMVLVNSEFKKVNGDLEMPYKMVMTADGKPMMTSTVKSIEVNKGLDDKLFDIESAKKEDLGKMDMDAMMKMMQKK
jgi:outer membrane lipoprotein-sorting protein